jgi:hypothetical protein
LPSPTTTGPGTVVLVVPADVPSVELLAGTTLGSGAADADVDGRADAPELPPPQPATATMTRATNHRTDRF